MKKKIIKRPKFERIQTGTIDVDVYVASDGQEFESEFQAKQHEWEIKRQFQPIFLPHWAEMFYAESSEDIEGYEEYHDMSYKNKKYDKDLLKYPNWFVMYSGTPGEYSDEYDYCENVYIVTLDEFRNYINSIIPTK